MFGVTTDPAWVAMISPPAKSIPARRRPLRLGVWQPPQPARAAKYLPYFSGSERSGDATCPTGLGTDLISRFMGKSTWVLGRACRIGANESRYATTPRRPYPT